MDSSRFRDLLLSDVCLNGKKLDMSPFLGLHNDHLKFVQKRLRFGFEKLKLEISKAKKPTFSTTNISNLMSNASVVEPDLSNSDELSDKFLEEAFIEGRGTITGLKLCRCTLVSDFGVFSIARHCKALTQLDLDGCVKVTDAGVIFVARSCPSITYLNVSNISFNGCFVEYVTQLPQLVTFIMRGSSCLTMNDQYFPWPEDEDPPKRGFVFICDSSLAESPLAGFFHIVVADVQVEKNGKSKSQFGKKEKSKDKSSAHGSSFGKEEKSKDKSPKESAHGSSKEGAHGSSKEGAHGSSKEGAHARMMKEVIRDKLRKLGDRKPASAHGSDTEDAHAFDARMKELIREKMRKFGDRKPACKRKSAPS